MELQRNSEIFWFPTYRQDANQHFTWIDFLTLKVVNYDGLLICTGGRMMVGGWGGDRPDNSFDSVDMFPRKFWNIQSLLNGISYIEGWLAKFSTLETLTTHNNYFNPCNGESWVFNKLENTCMQNVGVFAPFFWQFFRLFSQKAFEIYKILQKWNIFARNVCYFAIVMQSL